MRIAGAIVVAVGLGYGLAQGYKMILGTAPDGATPVVRGDSAPTKTKPTDPGGKQFAHTDSKVMGRLGEGTPATTASLDTPSASPSDPEAAAGGDVDAGGARKVTTLVVGRDGSIVPPQAPAAAPPAEPGGNAGAVAVPGVTMVDGFGGQYPGAVTTTATAVPDTARQTPPAARQPLVVTPPRVRGCPPPSPRAEPLRVEPGCRSQASDAPIGCADEAGGACSRRVPGSAAPTATGGNGYVVVLASVPASGGSRLVALKKFADMQQKYGSVLQNKTPDVREANLGAKGIYHRLLVGPPGSRAQASALCGELKSAGYKDCWVTAY